MILSENLNTYVCKVKWKKKVFFCFSGFFVGECCILNPPYLHMILLPVSIHLLLHLLRPHPNLNLMTMI